LVNIPYKISIGSLTWKDVVERMWLLMLDRCHLLSRTAALQDTADYLGIPISEALSRATAPDARMRHKLAWYSRERRTEADIQAFYGEVNDYLFNLPLRYRLHTWHFVPRLSPGPRILEYGCGPAEMTKWLLRRYPQYRYTVADLAVASTLSFIRYRFRGQPVQILEIGLHKEGLPLRETYDFIACIDVLEHCLDPLMVVEHLYEHLEQRGVLYTNFLIERSTFESDQDSENLKASALKHDAVIDFLESNFVPIKSMQRLEADQDVVTGWACMGIYRKA
jgi:2-polyprenyl-3-methyl-5-hydroxy-6-metoxy-1,4-benzoquinol methylase